MKKIEAVLALADGTVFKGHAFGALKTVENASVGEVVFNTSMYGYQEILTDPSYAGQIMCFSYPHIGNVGSNAEDVESNAVHVEGVVLRNLSKRHSNFRALKSLEAYLIDYNVMGLADIDTRALVTHIRDKGCQMGAIAAGSCINADDLVDIAKSHGSMEGKNYVRYVSCEDAYAWNELPWSLTKGGYTKLSYDELLERPHVVAIDYGVKYNILRSLLAAGFRVTVVPAAFSAEQIMALRPDALFLSNGPGDPATLNYEIAVVKKLLGLVPMFGICIGHQIMAQAIGAKTYKLKFGHRGGNHPVMDLKTKKVEISVQNHGFAVDRATLPKYADLTHINLNDSTVEGLEIKEAQAFCVQYHPEASSGPRDSQYLFRRFFAMVTNDQHIVNEKAA